MAQKKKRKENLEAYSSTSRFYVEVVNLKQKIDFQLFVLSFQSIKSVKKHEKRKIIQIKYTLFYLIS